MARNFLHSRCDPAPGRRHEPPQTKPPFARARNAGGEAASAEAEAGEPIEASLFRRLAGDKHGKSNTGPEYAVESRNIGFGYPNGPPVLRDRVEVRRGHIHGLIGRNGSGKSTLANVIAGRLAVSRRNGSINGVRVDGAPPRKRARLGMRRTFQAAELVRELTPGQTRQRPLT